MTMKRRIGNPRRSHSGATLAEFIIVAPVVMIVGMTTVQAGLIYHGKTTLNYATFEAARRGAVNNAQLSIMRRELGLRLAPLEGGDGSAEGAMKAMARSSVAVQDRVRTRLKILNPTTAAFEDWGVDSPEFNRRVIPNSHLRHREHSIGSTSGLSLRDANLLKIEVTHGLSLKVPIVAGVISRAMVLVDPDNALYYARRQFPLKAVATVRMQSEAWEDEIVTANLPPDSDEADPSTGSTSGESGHDTPTGLDEPADEGLMDECTGGEFGLGSNPVLMDASDYEQGVCPAVQTGLGHIAPAGDEC